MDEAEIRAEIERRRKRAVELKLREGFWEFYRKHLKRVGEQLSKDPELLPPEIVGSVVVSGDAVEFLFNGGSYRFICAEGKKEHDRDWNGDGTTTSAFTFFLKVDGELVLEFEMKQITVFTPDFPDTKERMGSVKAFVEGPWVESLAEMKVLFDNRWCEIQKRRNSPRDAQLLKEDMKRFGL